MASLSGVNTYTGGTTINTGATLEFGQSGSLPSAGTVIVNSGAIAAMGFALDQASLDRIDPTSAGVVALAANSSNTLNFTGLPGVSFGTTGSFTYGGQLTPSGTTYRLGGGGGTLTVTSSLTGSNSLIVDDNDTKPGTLILTGNNSYAGGTRLSTGTLEIGSNSALGTGALSMAPGTTLAFAGGNFAVANTISLGGFATFTPAAGTTQTLLGSISGDSASGFTMVGPGTLTLAGNSSAFAGTTLVTGGELLVGEASTPPAVLGGPVTAAAGGIVAGYGAIGGPLNNSGTVMPGGMSIGTLTIGGNYTQTAGGTLTIEVGPSTASKLTVGGAASLNGTLVLVFEPGAYSPHNYTLLTASSLSGAFSTVTGTNPGGLLPQTILYKGDPSVVLQLGYGGTLAPTNDTIYSAVTSIAVMNAQEINGIILDRIGARQAGISDGQVTAPAPSGVSAAQLAQAGGGNAAAVGEAAAALPGALSSRGVWFRGIGGFASVNGNSSAPGFTGSTGGFLAGYDRAVDENIYLGIAGGYLRGTIDEHSTSNGTEGSARLNVYGGVLAGENLFSATVGYANDSFTTSRGIVPAVGTASERHSGNEGTAAGQWSLPLAIQGYGGGTAMLTPKVGIEYLYLPEGAFNETGASGFDLSNSGHATDSLQPYVGAALSQKFVTADGTEIAPELRLGYAHELRDTRLLTVTAVGGASFSVAGVRPARDQVTTGIGVVMQATPNLWAYADYDTILHTGNTSEQTIQAGLRLKF